MDEPQIRPSAFTRQPAPTRAAIYARVSTHNNGQDPEMQTRELLEYCERHGWELAGCYVDNGISGSEESRPESNRLMTDARQRKLDVVLVWTLDRFGRSLKHLVNALAEFEALGIIFASLKDNLDLSTPSGRLMFQIIVAMAEFERSLIRERVMAGLRNAKAKGQKLGRPTVAVDASKIAALRAQGHSWDTIHRETGITKGTAQRAFYGLVQTTKTLARGF